MERDWRSVVLDNVDYCRDSANEGKDNVLKLRRESLDVRVESLIVGGSVGLANGVLISAAGLNLLHHDNPSGRLGDAVSCELDGIMI